MNVIREQLDRYIAEGGMTLIPINVWDKKTTSENGKVQLRGKTPLHNNWTKETIDSATVMALAEKGHNVGFRLKNTDLIIDVDERNYDEGVNSLTKLTDALGLGDLAFAAPTVITGSGGFHYYFRKPADMHVSENISEFPGIEFKTKGRQVICAGSKHPNGEHYMWDEFSLELDERPTIPQTLIDFIEYVPVEKNMQDAGGELTNAQLELLLTQIPAESYDDNGKWFKIMCAAHHATGGVGIDPFLAWSMEDEKYSDDENSIRIRWTSLGKSENTMTIGTLYSEIRKHGGDANILASCKDFEEFKDFVEAPDAEGPDSNIPTLHSPTVGEALGEIAKEGSHSSLENIDNTDEETIVIANELASKLTKDSTKDERQKAFRSMLHINSSVDRLDSSETIKENLNMNLAGFNRYAKATKEDMDVGLDQDMARVLAELTYKVKFNDCKGLIYSIGEQFWKYNGTFWEVITKKYLEKMVMEALDEMKKKMKVKRSENTLVNDASLILSRLCSVNDDTLGLLGKPKSIVNCQNGELWINDDGTVELRNHKPESHLLQVLKVDYDPAATAPKFEEMLKSTFSQFSDSEDMVEFVYEMIGYIIQPNKNLEKWFLFHGTGGDGKSTLIRIISSLLGRSVMPEKISTFGTDNHIVSDLHGKLLIVDDDLDYRTKLPDGMIKKLCGRNDMTGNPKGGKTERFTPATTLILSGNSYPRTDDLSEGGRRRPIVVPFDRNFHREDGGGIINIDALIIKEELPGVLNLVLAGLKRLRERGRFKEPTSCVVAKKKWIGDSNMTAMFVSDCINETGKLEDTMSLKHAYDLYDEWCLDNKIQFRTGKQHFRQNMEALGMPSSQIGRNVKGFRRITAKEDNIPVDDFDDVVIGESH